MALLLLGGLLLLVAWVFWTLCIVESQRPVTISLVVKVQRGEEYLDPFLRLICCLFRQSMHISLREIWILALDEGEATHRIIHRLNLAYPLFRFRALVEQSHEDFNEANGQVLVILDLVNRLTPLAALQAVTQLLSASPTSPGTIALTPGD